MVGAAGFSEIVVHVYQITVKLSYNVMKGAEYFVWL
jgi:hypothetical protein